MGGNVISLRDSTSEAERSAQLWEGIVRFMEANGKTKIEIGLADAKHVARLMRSEASGREQAPQAQIPASGEGGPASRQERRPSAQQDRGADGLDPQETRQTVAGSRCHRANRLNAQAIEARRAETQGGSVHESAVTEGHAPEPDSQRGSHEG